MKQIDLIYRTMFAELGQRSFDAAFTHDFPSHGRFVSMEIKGRRYWYFDLSTKGQTRRRYVGPADDPQIAERVARFKALKPAEQAQHKMVSSLVNDAGLPRADQFTGDVLQAISLAGFFRMRGVLVGTVAYQCYGGLLGVLLPGAHMQTGDTDLAQFHSISVAVDDAMPPILEVLKGVDDSFRDAPHQADGRMSSQFVNEAGYKVEFLVPNRGGDDLGSRPAAMPALGGAAAQPLRFLDFLIRDPVRTVLLHRSGVTVTVPAPERYAIHKLIVAQRRSRDSVSRAKRDKDLNQATSLFTALAEFRRAADLRDCFMEAWERGPSWRAALSEAFPGLWATVSVAAKDAFCAAVRRGSGAFPLDLAGS